MGASELKPKVDGEALKVAKVVLKRRDRNLAANAARAKKIQEMRKLRKSKPQLVRTVNGDVLLKQSKNRNLDRKHAIVSKLKGVMERRIPESTTCLLVARNQRSVNSKGAKQALVALGLLPMDACRIVTASAKNLDLIRACDAYVFYGVPTPEVVSTLVHKKAYLANTPKEGTEKPEPKPLNNNAIIEDTFGEDGLICVEDLVDVLLKGKENEDLFNKVNQFIARFTVNHENRIPGTKFVNERATRGFQPRIETIMSRLV
jgi:large subunit ribosomal protein L7e